MISKVKMECIRKGVVWSFKKKPTGLDCIRRRQDGGSGALAPSKGQLISKGLFGVFNSPKKQTKNVCPNRLGQKFKLSISFLLKRHFEIN